MGGSTGAKLPASGEVSVLATQPAATPHRYACVCVLVCVVCFQVVNLDPVIEDDAELQKYSKVRLRGASVHVGGLSLTSYLSC